MADTMMRIMVYDKCQCDPKKCTAKRMIKFGLAESVALSSVPSGAIVLSPFAENALSPADRAAAGAKGIAVMDLTWTNIDGFPKVRRAKERALPYLLASNPVNWGRPMELNSAEAVFASLMILGESEQARAFLGRFNWAPEFLRLNGELLEEYAGARDSSDVVRIQNDYVKCITKR